MLLNPRLGRRAPARLVFVATLLHLAPTGRAAPPPPGDPVRYTVRFPAPQTHYVEVEAVVPTGGAGQLTLMMPVWTPGSYLVREYARQVEGLTARAPDGRALAVEKVRKNRWAVSTGGEATVAVSYRVYSREMGVQSNWVDGGFALLNGAATFLTAVEPDARARPHEVTVELPGRWKSSYSALADAPGAKPHRYVAPDYDALVDGPIYAGNPAVYTFTVDGKPHVLLNEGENGVWDGPRSARDVEAIVRAQRDFWGTLPYDRYVFFNLLTEAGGGLEHKDSTVLMSSRWGTRTRRGYLNWLELVSHELFHAWNVKRLRPVELGPFDYENEVTTRSLWIAEGVTSYYGRLLVRRAGLCTDAEYLAGRPRSRREPDSDEPTGDVAQLQMTPGRLVQPLESSSFDSWIKFYRPDENAANTAISYYTKGAVVGWLLDAKVRKVTGGKKSLDDVMRLAYARYSGARGYTPAEFRAAARDVAGTDLSDWFRHALETTDDLDYAEALDWFGLRFKDDKPGADKDKEKSQGKEPEPPRAWLGLVTKGDGGRLLVTQVKRGTPGFDAGFNVGDEILALGDDRVRPESWRDRMEQFRPGDKVSVLIARRDRLDRLAVVFAQEPPRPWTLEIDPTADEARPAHRRAWLDGAH
jgi:predicted metalloprotease with PDZ domain